MSAGEPPDAADAAVNDSAPPGRTDRPVFRRILAAQTDLARTGVQRKAAGQYSTRPLEDVLAAVGSALIKAGLTLQQSVIAIERSEVAVKNGVMRHTLVRVRYTLTCSSTGDSVSSEFAGESADALDKGLSKAINASYKYWSLQTFQIPAEADRDLPAEPAPAPSRPAVDGRLLATYRRPLTAVQQQETQDRSAQDPAWAAADIGPDAVATEMIMELLAYSEDKRDSAARWAARQELPPAEFRRILVGRLMGQRAGPAS